MFLFVWFSFRIEIPPHSRSGKIRWIPTEACLLLFVHDFGVNDRALVLSAFLVAARLAAFRPASARLRTAAL
jgi:hypothetical protein